MSLPQKPKPKPPTLEATRAEYERLFETMQIVPARAGEVAAVVARAKAARARYQAVAAEIGCPWEAVAAIHQMESSGRFNRHLHNGDPLSARTVRVPAGRPLEGNPPFTWEQSAEDALRLMGWDKATDWTLPAMLHRIEKFNGFGYRMYHPETLTPYLWSFTTHYSRGKYAADGKWDARLVSQQVGAAAIIKGLMA